MSVMTVNQENFSNEVLEAKTPVLVDFWASWCGPCRMMSPILDQLAQKHPELRVGKVNVDEQPELATRFQVMSIPMLVLFRDGEAVASAVGVRPLEELERVLHL